MCINVCNTHFKALFERYKEWCSLNEIRSWMELRSFLQQGPDRVERVHVGPELGLGPFILIGPNLEPEYIQSESNPLTY